MHACNYELFVMWVWYYSQQDVRSFRLALTSTHGALYARYICYISYILDTVVLPTVNLLTNHDYLVMQQQW